MISEAVEPQRWSVGRWLTLIGLVLGTQIGLIFWLGKPQSVARTVFPPAPTIELASPGMSNLLALSDPSLFALPHLQSFSGVAWLTITNPQFPGFVWSEPTQLQPLREDQLGADFREFMVSHRFDPVPTFEQLDLVLKVPPLEQVLALPTNSGLRLTGPLAGRRLAVTPFLPPWPSAEILTNSMVHVLVGADGIPVSATLLKPNAQNEADRYALSVARNLRFEPLKIDDPANPMAGLTWGQLVFEWHIVPLPATNSPTKE